MVSNGNDQFQFDGITEKEQKSTETYLRDVYKSAADLNRALVQQTKDGIAIWTQAISGRYQPDKAFQDMATLYARSIAVWGEMAKVWTGYMPGDNQSTDE